MKLHLDALGSDVVLVPDASGERFTAVIPSAALLTGLGPADVNRKFIGHLLVTTGAEVGQHNIFGDVRTAGVPPVAVHGVAADVQFSDHLINIA